MRTKTNKTNSAATVVNAVKSLKNCIVKVRSMVSKVINVIFFFPLLGKKVDHKTLSEGVHCKHIFNGTVQGLIDFLCCLTACLKRNLVVNKRNLPMVFR
jgi:hypothetical protein